MSETKRVILTNAVSLSMLGSRKEAMLNVIELDLDRVKQLISGGFESAIGHESTAAFLSQLLGVEVPANRQQVLIDESTTLVVFQLQSRLPEGKVLTEDELKQVRYKFYLVTLATGGEVR